MITLKMLLYFCVNLCSAEQSSCSLLSALSMAGHLQASVLAAWHSLETEHSLRSCEQGLHPQVHQIAVSLQNMLHSIKGVQKVQANINVAGFIYWCKLHQPQKTLIQL